MVSTSAANRSAAGVAFLVCAAQDAFAALQAPDPALDAERAVMAVAAAAEGARR